jgi:hypothetical protein
MNTVYHQSESLWTVVCCMTGVFCDLRDRGKILPAELHILTNPTITIIYPEIY